MWHHRSISVEAHKPVDIHPNFEFSTPLRVQVQLKSILGQKVVAETVGNWPGPVGISNQARILVGLVIKKSGDVERIEFQNSIVFEENNHLVAAINIS